VGTQYRSAIYYDNDSQKNTAETVIQELEKNNVWDNPIVTEVAPFQKFYPAEDYHQDYYKQNTDEPYCRIVIEPKVVKLRKYFMDKLKK